MFRTDRVTVNVRLEDATSSKDPIAQEQEFEEIVESPVEARDQPPMEDDSSAGKESLRRSLPEGHPVKAFTARTEHGDKVGLRGGSSFTFVKYQGIQQQHHREGKATQGRRQVSFSQEHFVFRLASGGGGLREGQTIGWVKVKQRSNAEEEEEELVEIALHLLFPSFPLLFS